MGESESMNGGRRRDVGGLGAMGLEVAAVEAQRRTVSEMERLAEKAVRQRETARAKALREAEAKKQEIDQKAREAEARMEARRSQTCLLLAEVDAATAQARSLWNIAVSADSTIAESNAALRSEEMMVLQAIFGEEVRQDFEVVEVSYQEGKQG